MFIGILVLAVGVVFLLQNLGYVNGSVWGIIWPAIIIVIGLSMIFRGRMRRSILAQKKK